MPSWQHQILRLAQLAFLAFNRRFVALDVAKERRAAALAEKMFKLPPGVRASAATANGVPVEWIVPAGLATEHVLMYVHGGAFYSGTLAGACPVAARVALAGRARAFTLDYRLSPEHPFPAALEDLASAYGWLLANGVSPANVVWVGDSAGGNLALALLVQLRDRGQPLPRGVVCLSPATDLTMGGETWITNAGRDLLLNPEKIRAAIELYLRGADPRTPLASPLFADLRGLPPVLLLVGSEEHLLSDSTRWAEKARAAGVAATVEVWPGMQHGWHLTGDFVPEGRQALARLGEFIQRGPVP